MEPFIGKLDVTELCRICANIGNQLMPIFRGEGLDHNIPSLIEKYLPIISISESDNLPLQICYQCASTMISWHNLYEGCPIAGERLHRILHNRYQNILSENNDDESLDYNHEPMSPNDENVNRIYDFLDDNYDAKFPNIENSRQTFSTLPSDNLIVNKTTDKPVDKTLKVVAQVADTGRKQYEESKSKRHETLYMCSYLNCYRIYSTESGVIQHGLYEHNRSYSAEVSYRVIEQCNYCHLLFFSEFDVYKHLMLVHNGEGEPLVEKEMVTEKSTPIRERFHQKRGCLTREKCHVKSRDKRLPCKFCNKTFHSALSLGQHILGFHVIPNEIKKPVKNEICKNINKQEIADIVELHNEVPRQVQLFEPVSALATPQHKELNEIFYGDDDVKIVKSDDSINVKGETIFKCDICRLCFTKKRYLMGHKQREHTVRVKKKTNFECNICNKSLTSKRNLMVHRQRHMETTFECDVCSQSFEKKLSLIKHLRKHTNKLNMIAIFKCDVCSKSFTKKSNLMAHQQRHTAIGVNVEATFECHICSRRFANKINLMNHQRRHTDKRYMCDHCGKPFSSESDLTKHLCQISNNNKRFECVHCGRHLSSKFSMIKHLQLHSGEKPFQCSQCELSFTYRSSWKAHQLMHEPELKQKCHMCPKAFRYKNSLDLHLMRRHNPNGRTFKCNQCDKAFYTKQNLINHTPIHVSERPFSCSVCSCAFKKKSYLNIHQRRYHNNLEKHIHLHSQIRLLNGAKKDGHNLSMCQPGVYENLRTTIQGKWAWKCDHCEYYSHFRHRFVDHYRMHTGEKPYTCPICGKCFRFKTNLLKHKYSQFHNRGTSLKCDVCGDNFHQVKYKFMHVHRIHNPSKSSLECDKCGEHLPDKNSLIDHIQSHAGERPHKCSKCGASFIYSSSLKVHQLEHQIHKCNLCSKVLRSKQSLNLHLKRHTGDLKFKCNHCDKTFHSRSHLGLHKFVHSDARPFECTKCGVVLKYKRSLERHEKSHN